MDVAYYIIIHNNNALIFLIFSDNFDVPSIHLEKSHYHKYSVQGKKHLRSYMKTITKGDETYSFIGVDACLDPGPRRPFNFIGVLTPEEFQLLENFERDSRGSNGTVWFGMI